jgi:prolyl-tRNA editing enzyme YbaK/EbsC (Cys-tRNA(Pro) deacylase)
LHGQEDVSRFLALSGANYEIKVLDQSTRTSTLAALALGCTIDEIAKSVVFLGPSVSVVVLSGGRRVDIGKLGRDVGGAVRAGTPDEVLAATGYRVGGVPPFPHEPGIRVLVDRSIMDFEAVWAAGGASNVVFRIRPGDLLRLVGGGAHDLAAGDAQI